MRSPSVGGVTKLRPAGWRSPWRCWVRARSCKRLSPVFGDACRWTMRRRYGELCQRTKVLVGAAGERVADVDLYAYLVSIQVPIPSARRSSGLGLCGWCLWEYAPDMTVGSPYAGCWSYRVRRARGTAHRRAAGP